MPLIAGVVGAGALSSYIGGSQAKKQAEAALAQQKAFTEKAIAELQKVVPPGVDAQKIVLENPKLVFDYVPQLAQEFPEIKSSFENIEVDPRLKEAQTASLAGLQERAQGGLTPDDIAEIQNIKNSIAAQARAQDSSIIQNMEQRGMGGSGAELMARLAASQQAAQKASIDSQQLASQDYQAKIDALLQLGNLAGSQRQQAYNEEAQKASALDAVARINQAARYDIQGQNVDRTNQSRLAQSELKQQLENQRANTANTQETHNKGLLQSNYQNQLAKAQSLANAYTGAGSQALAAGQNQAANTMAMWQGIGQAGMGGAQLYGAMSKNPTTKTNEEEPYSAYDKLTSGFRS